MTFNQRRRNTIGHKIANNDQKLNDKLFVEKIQNQDEEEENIFPLANDINSDENRFCQKNT